MSRFTLGHLAFFLTLRRVASLGFSQPDRMERLGVILQGEIMGRECADRSTIAKAGQRLSFKRIVVGGDNSGSSDIVLPPPGRMGAAIYIGATNEDGSERMTLPQSGVFTVRLDVMGDDRDSGKMAGYALDVAREGR